MAHHTPSHDAHTPTANPRTRTIAAHDNTDAIAERAHITALIASRYNSRRAKELADALGIDLTYWNAAQELTNRRLAQLTPTGQRTPAPRYHLPEQLATHHANPKNARTPSSTNPVPAPAGPKADPCRLWQSSIAKYIVTGKQIGRAHV